MNATIDSYLQQLGVGDEEVSEGVAGIPSDALPWHLLPGPHLGWQLAALAGAHGAQVALGIAAWICIGGGTLSGRLDYGWLAAWALILASTVPLTALTAYLEGLVTIRISSGIKRRMLRGTLAMDPDRLRAQGTGNLLGSALEAEAIDAVTSGAGIAIGMSIIELLILPFLLYWGAATTAELLVLMAFMGTMVILVGINIRQRSAWTERRVGMTNRLVENMIAHRTRLAQQHPSHWHCSEDEDLAGYLVTSCRLDAGTARIAALLVRAYVIVALAAMFPAILSGTATLAQMAITLGVVLSASASLGSLAAGLTQAAAAWTAWKRVRPMLADANATASPESSILRPAECNTTDRDAVLPVLSAQDIHFQHHGRGDTVIKGCNLNVGAGDRILLEGASGSGKSTFASILAGHRIAASGLVHSAGLDRHTWGERAWRRRVVLVPQYHENHLFSASLSFNLLMGRPLPHSQQDMCEAAAVCTELGLDGLIERMPAGLAQMVGDTGWRVSQGERSRIFLARALLQEPAVVVLDESLAALDPENIRQSLACIRARARSLILVAHP